MESLIAVTAIIITVFIFLINSAWHPTGVDGLLILIFVLLILYALYLSLKNFFPQKHKDLAILEEKRFDEIIRFSEKDLYSSIIYDLKKAYEMNEKKYNEIMNNIRLSFQLFLLALLPLFLLMARAII